MYKRQVASGHDLQHEQLEDLFRSTYQRYPKDWLKDRLDESDNLDIEQEVNKFVKWASMKAKLEHPVKIELSYDTQEAQDGHHTGRHVEGDDTLWVYAKNRNLVDILRTVAHEIWHSRQSELNMIKPGDSYPGSPIAVSYTHLTLPTNREV